jgi:hypothetical protein
MDNSSLLEDFFTRLKLPCPALVNDFHQKMKSVSEFYLTSRTDNCPSPQNMDWYINEIKANTVKDYLTVAHIGHGINSWRFYLFTVQGNLAFFLERSFGGAYMDNDSAAASISQSLSAAAALGKSLSDKLLIVESDTLGNQQKRITYSQSQHP